MQELNLYPQCLLHCRQVLYPLSHLGSPGCKEHHNNTLNASARDLLFNINLGDSRFACDHVRWTLSLGLWPTHMPWLGSVWDGPWDHSHRNDWLATHHLSQVGGSPDPCCRWWALRNGWSIEGDPGVSSRPVRMTLGPDYNTASNTPGTWILVSHTEGGRKHLCAPDGTTSASEGHPCQLLRAVGELLEGTAPPCYLCVASAVDASRMCAESKCGQ